MKRPSKLNRKQLALRLFGIAVAVNGILLYCYMPSEKKDNTKANLAEGMIELKISSTLFTSFENNKQILLTQGSGQSIGPVMLLAQDENSITIAISGDLYRQHHLRLGQENWAALPYLSGMQTKPHKNGINYEIAY